MLAKRKIANILMASIMVLVVFTAGCRASSSPSPEPQVTPKAEPVTFAVYQNSERGYSIEYPRGWTFNEQWLGKGFSVDFKSADSSYGVYIYTESRTGENTLANAISDSKDYFKYQPHIKLISEAYITVGNGVAAHEIIYVAGSGENEEKSRYIIFVRGQQSFSVMISGHPADIEQWQQTVDSMLGSFSLLPSYADAPDNQEPGGTYTDTRYGFSVSYPIGWFEVPTGRPGQLVSFAYSEEGHPGATISLVPLDKETTLAEYVALLIHSLSQDWSNYQLVSQGEKALQNGTRAYEIVFSGTVEERSLKCKYLVVFQGNDVFLVMGFSSPELFEQDEGRMDKFLYSFNLE